MAAVPLFKLAPDLQVSRLCLGTMTFGEQNTLPESFCLLDAAFDAGINFFDSAEMYPVPQRKETHGRSEEYVGRWMRSRKIPRDRVVLATKVSGPSGQMTWIRGGPKSLDSNNILVAINGRINLLAYSPLAMGILSGKYFSPGRGPSDARMNLYRGRYREGESRYNLLNPIVEAAVKEYMRIAAKYDVLPAQLAIAFVLKHPLVASTILGVTKQWQLKEVIEAARIQLPIEVMDEINEIHAKYPNPCP